MLRSYLQLMRLPAAFTAMADVLAGYFFVSPQQVDLSELVWLLLCSSMLYASGMVFNDYFDYEVDLRERPARPLPSGEVPLSVAFVLGSALAVGGVLCAAMVNSYSFILSFALVALILLYDGKTKGIPWVGPINMGGCRFLNILLGASVVPIGAASRYLIAAVMMLYVISIMPLSKREVQGGDGRAIAASLLGMIAVFFSIALLRIGGLLAQNAFFLFFAIFGISVSASFARLFSEPGPEAMQLAVKRLVLSIVLLDSTFASGSAGMLGGLLVLCLLIPSSLLSRLVYIA